MSTVSHTTALSDGRLQASALWSLESTITVGPRLIKPVNDQRILIRDYFCSLFWNFGILDFFDFLIWIPNVYVNCQQKNACYFFPEHMYIISYCITYQANTLIDC